METVSSELAEAACRGTKELAGKYDPPFSDSQVTCTELVDDDTELCDDGASIEKTEEDDDEAADEIVEP